MISASWPQDLGYSPATAASGCGETLVFIESAGDPGLDAIVLAPGTRGAAGYHTTGCVHICAWDQDLWEESRLDFFEDHQGIFDRLELPYDRCEGYVLCKWGEPTIRAYQLLHILLHELGHHHDRVTWRSQADAARGEPYAEAYARKYADRIWDRYFEVFGF